MASLFIILNVFSNWELSSCLKNNNENQPRDIPRKHIWTFACEFRKFTVSHEPLRIASIKRVLANFGYLRKLIYAKIFGATANFRNRSYDCFLKMPRGRFCRVCAIFKHSSEAQMWSFEIIYNLNHINTKASSAYVLFGSKSCFSSIKTMPLHCFCLKSGNFDAE